MYTYQRVSIELVDYLAVGDNLTEDNVYELLTSSQSCFLVISKEILFEWSSPGLWVARPEANALIF